MLTFSDFLDSGFLNGDDFRRRHSNDSKHNNKGERQKRLVQ